MKKAMVDGMACSSFLFDEGFLEEESKTSALAFDEPKNVSWRQRQHDYWP